MRQALAALQSLLDKRKALAERIKTSGIAKHVFETTNLPRVRDTYGQDDLPQE